MRKLSVGWLPSFFLWSRNSHQGEVVADKEVRACRKNVKQVFLLCFLKKFVSWRGQPINRQLDRWLQSSKGKRRAGQVFPSKKRTRKRFWRSAVSIAPQISVPFLHAQHVFFVICVYTEWQQILSNRLAGETEVIFYFLIAATFFQVFRLLLCLLLRGQLSYFSDTLCLLQKRTSVKIRANISVTYVHVAISVPQMGSLCLDTELIKLYLWNCW